MLRLLYRQFRLDPVRTLLTWIAIAAVVAVVLILEGFNEGLMRQMRETVEKRGGDLILTQAGVSNMSIARSVLPQYTRLDVEEIEGVAAAHPLTAIYVIYEQDEVRTPVFLVVYDSGGGPDGFVAGGPPTGAREIVIDRSLAEKYGLDVGEALVVTGFRFTISGITRDNASAFTPLGFVRFDDLIDFYFESDLATDISTFPLLSFLLVEMADDADPEEVAARIEGSIPSADVHATGQLARNDEIVGRVLFGPIFRLLIGIGYVIGALVVGIIMFSAVNARRREFGVIKALGFTHGFMSLVVLTEALVLTAAAFPAGALMAGVFAAVVEGTAPLYRILPAEPLPLLRTAAACVVFAAAGAMAPLRRLRRIDPGIAFRS
jgi:ABC-type antimicrobial peptide transport system permease subunit